jgi:acyl carrier protein
LTKQSQEATERKIFLGIVARALDRKREEVRMSSRLFSELGSESLDLLDLAFSLEMEFRISMPRTDLLVRAYEFFGEEAVIQDGVITELGLRLIGKLMPEVDRADLGPSLTVIGFRDLIRVDSLYRVVRRLLDAKRATACLHCGGKMVDAADEPELVCTVCGKTAPLPSGEALLASDLEEAVKEFGISPQRNDRGR